MLVRLGGIRFSDRNDAAIPGIDAVHESPDCAALAAGIPALEDDDGGAPGAGALLHVVREGFLRRVQALLVVGSAQPQRCTPAQLWSCPAGLGQPRCRWPVRLRQAPGERVGQGLCDDVAACSGSTAVQHLPARTGGVGDGEQALGMGDKVVVFGQVAPLVGARAPG